MNRLIAVAESQLGAPYVWGGSNPVQGFDCSGYVQWVLKSVGLDVPGKQNAQQIFNQFEHNSTWNSYTTGALAFYGKSVTEITHVALVIDSYRIYESAGGNHLTMTREDAALVGGCVRGNIIKYRADLVAVLKPSYVSIGYP